MNRRNLRCLQITCFFGVFASAHTPPTNEPFKYNNERNSHARAEKQVIQHPVGKDLSHVQLEKNTASKEFVSRRPSGKTPAARLFSMYNSQMEDHLKLDTDLKLDGLKGDGPYDIRVGTIGRRLLSESKPTEAKSEQAAKASPKQPASGDGQELTNKGPEDYIVHWPLLRSKIEALEKKINASAKQFDKTEKALLELVNRGDKMEKEAREVSNHDRLGNLENTFAVSEVKALRRQYKKINNDLKSLKEVVVEQENNYNEIEMDAEIKKLEDEFRKRKEFLDIDAVLNSGYSAMAGSMADTTNFARSVLQETGNAAPELLFRFGDDPGEKTYLSEDLVNLQENIDALSGNKLARPDPDLQKVADVLVELLSRKSRSLRGRDRTNTPEMAKYTSRRRTRSAEQEYDDAEESHRVVAPSEVKDVLSGPDLNVAYDKSDEVGAKFAKVGKDEKPYNRHVNNEKSDKEDIVLKQNKPSSKSETKSADKNVLGRVQAEKDAKMEKEENGAMSAKGKGDTNDDDGNDDVDESEGAVEAEGDKIREKQESEEDSAESDVNKDVVKEEQEEVHDVDDNGETEETVLQTEANAALPGDSVGSTIKETPEELDEDIEISNSPLYKSDPSLPPSSGSSGAPGSLRFWQRELDKLDEAEKRNAKFVGALKQTFNKLTLGPEDTGSEERGGDPSSDGQSFRISDSDGGNHMSGGVGEEKTSAPLSQSVQDIIEKTKEKEAGLHVPRTHIKYNALDETLIGLEMPGDNRKGSRSNAWAQEPDLTTSLDQSPDSILGEIREPQKMDGKSRFTKALEKALRKQEEVIANDNSRSDRLKSWGEADESLVDLYDDEISDPDEFDRMKQLYDLSDELLHPDVPMDGEIRAALDSDPDMSIAVDRLNNIERTLRKTHNEVLQKGVDELKDKLNGVKKLKQNIALDQVQRKEGEIEAEAKMIPLLEKRVDALSKKRIMQYDKMRLEMMKAYRQRKNEAKKIWENSWKNVRKLKKNRRLIDKMVEKKLLLL